MLRNDLGPIHRLGKIVLTAGAKQSLSGKDMLDALLLHMRGGSEDGECPLPLDCLEGCRLLNVYCSSKGQRFWIVTEADRTVTTVLMPEEL